MSIAAIGVGTVGTFAWYAATNATISPVAATAKMTTANGATSLGSFTVTAVVTNSPGAAKLTNGSGATYVWDAANTQNKPVTDAGTAMVEVQLKFTISYSGAISGDAAILAEWKLAVGNNKAYVTCHDASIDDDSTLTSAEQTRYTAIKTEAEGRNPVVPYGLKFAGNATTYSNTGDQDVEVKGNSDLKNITFNSGAAEITVSSAYVGVWGIDSFEQLQTDAYLAKFTPKFAA